MENKVEKGKRERVNAVKDGVTATKAAVRMMLVTAALLTTITTLTEPSAPRGEEPAISPINTQKHKQLT